MVTDENDYMELKRNLKEAIDSTVLLGDGQKFIASVLCAKIFKQFEDKQEILSPSDKPGE
jgi:hypothetical protein